MEGIKLIAFDLDGTLLNSKKEISPKTLEILKRAAEMKIELVPATGRFWSVVPDCLRNLNFIHYALTLNGAEVFDVENSKTIAKFEIPPERALKMARVFEDIDGIIYDCIFDGQGYMRRDFYGKIPDFMAGEWQTELVRKGRKPVEDFEAVIKNSKGIQKMQIFTLDKELRQNLLDALPIVFPKSVFTSSVPNNIEINDISADKGSALKFLADYLDIPIENTIAFGDGLNDLSMIKAAGLGIAMENSCHELLDCADSVTLDCDNDGVAEGIMKFCF